MVQLVKHDLQFILKQIKIAEAHSAGTPLDQIRVDADGNISTNPADPLAIPTTLSPYGLRTVDGSYNNMVAGREQWGAADNPFPRITDPDYRNEGDDAMPAGYVPGNNNDYGNLDQSVVDADPRIISNLIVDQTLDNPAAISAALTHAGLTGAAQLPAIRAIQTAHQAVKAAAPGEARTAAEAALKVVLDGYQIAMDGNSVIIPNVAPDEGLSAPYNGWFTLFGQFFDHGLDLVTKTGGTVYIPLSPDDPLYNPASPHTNFMVLTRTSNGGENQTTPWVDQNQTYTSNASHQLFLREYAMVDGKPVSTGKLLEGDRGLATWADVKEQARTMLGIELTDADITNIPMFVMDAYGEFVRGPNGFPQIVRSLGLDNKFGGTGADADVFEEGNPAAPISTAGAVRTGHAFLDDIAHDAATVNSRGLKTYADQDDELGMGVAAVTNPSYVEGGEGAAQPYPALNPAFDRTQAEGPDNPRYVAGNLPYLAANSAFNAAQPEGPSNPRYVQSATPALGENPVYDPAATTGDASMPYLPLSRFYDNEKLDAHYITGDGRGNENIGLSAVHHVFHSEHNHTVDQFKVRAIEAAIEGDVAFLREWLAADLPAGAVLPPAGASEAAILEFAKGLTWDGERLFQGARFTTEMQYQHLVFEEFARKVQPDVDAFVFNASVDINPNILAEFANVVYRFGHSMLNQQVAAVDADGNDVGMDLFQAFLNPVAFGSDTASHAVAAGAIVRGMTGQVGNEIDEFVTDVLRNQLVGIPLDLAALNIARGRETGMPSLNEARRQFQEKANGDTQLEAYANWTDFALNLKNPASIVNFIAAYGTHADITGATTVAAKREAAMRLVFGDATMDAQWQAGRTAFLNGTGAYASNLGGLEDVDLWVGGLAEKKMAFGGMLGSTFSFIFELQMENLQNADRFYYLSRVQGLNFLNELENNSLAKIVMNNTDLAETGYALPGDIFSVPDHVLYMDKAVQDKFGYVDPTGDDPWLGGLSPLVERRDANGDGVAEYIRYNGNDHVLIQGTNGNDHIVAGGGDDSVWGRDGDDRIEAGYGVDRIHGGKGDDIITNSGTDIGETDMLHGEEGNDVIHAGSGLALVFGNQGQDFIIAGPDGKEVFGGTGDDFIMGGGGADFLLGNEGDDWIEAGPGFDTSAGDNSELNFNSTIVGHDVMFAGEDEHDFDAESGDDIMVQGESVMRNEGMWGFDWAIHKFNSENADSDLLTPIFTTDEQDILRDRFDAVEALSGWVNDDVLRGDNRGSAGEAGGGLAGAEGTMVRHELTQAGVDRIHGLRDLLGDMIDARPTSGDLEAVVAFDSGNILLGGGGSDVIEGRGGDDYINGDAWLNVRIGIYQPGANGVPVLVASAETMGGVVTAEPGFTLPYAGRTLDALMLDRTLNPGQLKIIREVVDGGQNGDIDVAVYNDARANYTVTENDDGSFTVTHVTVTAGVDPATGKNRVSDGTDRIANIERLRFADGEVSMDLYRNRPHTGDVRIVQTPNTTNGSLTAVSSLEDLDGLNNLRFQWQVLGTGPNPTFTDIQGATNATFVPPDNLRGRVLRVEATYQDDLGRTERVQSLNTAEVGTNPIIIIFFPVGGHDNLAGTEGADLMLGLGGDDAMNGLGGNDTLVGGDGSDTLNGGAGADAMTGGSGSDTYVVDDAGDTVTEAANGGTDTVQTTLASYTLSANVENLAFTGTGDFTGTGNALSNDITGGAGNDTLDGGAGNDRLNGGAGADAMTGGAGNDTFVVDNAGDTVAESANGGTDTVETSLTAYTLADNVENLEYTGTAAFAGTGNAGANTITGGNGNDRLTGGGGNDDLSGGNGNDTFVATAGDGNDTYRGGNGIDTYDMSALTGAVTVDLATGFSTVNGQATGAGGTDTLQSIENVIGGSGNDTITGQGGVNRLDGGAGNDTLDGGGANGGNDVFAFGTAFGNDRINNFDSNAQNGQDLIDLSAAGVTDFGQLAIANTTVNGTSGARVTVAGQGTIFLAGVAANTLTAADFVFANGVAGPQAGGPVSLGLSSNRVAENTAGALVGTLSVAGSDPTDAFTFDLSGPSASLFTVVGNELRVKEGARLDYEAARSHEIVVTACDIEGVVHSERVTVAVQDVKGVNQTGSSRSETLRATAEDDTVRAGRGNDTVRGEDGNDRLYGGDGHDRVLGGTGHDRLYGERGNDRLHGGDGNDRLYGGDGHDLLDGGAGADRMEGGRGHDTYVVDHAGDRVVERGGQGTDKVYSSVSYSLSGQHVEHLTLTGQGDIRGVGNSLDNRITGNAGDNRLHGGRGDDRIDGGKGDDRMSGGSGEDTFVFRKGSGHDTVTDFRAGVDRIDARGLRGVDEMSDLTIVRSGDDVEIRHGSDVLVLEGVSPRDLDASDFIF